MNVFFSLQNARLTWFIIYGRLTSRIFAFVFWWVTAAEYYLISSLVTINKQKLWFFSVYVRITFVTSCYFQDILRGTFVLSSANLRMSIRWSFNSFPTSSIAVSLIFSLWFARLNKSLTDFYADFGRRFDIFLGRRGGRIVFDMDLQSFLGIDYRCLPVDSNVLGLWPIRVEFVVVFILPPKKNPPVFQPRHLTVWTRHTSADRRTRRDRVREFRQPSSPREELRNARHWNASGALNYPTPKTLRNVTTDVPFTVRVLLLLCFFFFLLLR